MTHIFLRPIYVAYGEINFAKTYFVSNAVVKWKNIQNIEKFILMKKLQFYFFRIFFLLVLCKNI
jgi:hypothetical protein